MKPGVIAVSTLVSAMTLGLALPTPTWASFTTCTGTNYNIANRVSPTLNCTILNPLNANVNDSVNPPPATYTVNVEQFFNINNWLFDGKYDNIGPVSGTDNSTLLNFTGNNQSGTFTRTGAQSLSDLMLVFKDGGSTNLVGYLIDLTTLGVGSGTYQSPFLEPPFDYPGNGPRDVSHISVYYREGTRPPQQIPEPGSLALAGLALIGFAAVRRRARS